MLRSRIKKVGTGTRLSAFASRVISAARGTGFSEVELRHLSYVLGSFETREEIMARGMASTLELASLSARDSAAVRAIIGRAHASISDGNEPAKSDMEKLKAILSNSGRISPGAKRRMCRELERDLNVVEKLWTCVENVDRKLSARPSKSK